MGRSLDKRRFNVKEENGNIVYTGRIEDIAKHFGLSVKTVQNSAYNHKRILRKYRLIETSEQYMLYKVTETDTGATVIGSWEELLEKLGYSEYTTLMIKNNKYEWGNWHTEELGYHIKVNDEWVKV